MTRPPVPNLCASSMNNQPAQVQKIRFPNKQKPVSLFPRRMKWLYLGLGFVLGVLAFWGLNTWLNSRPTTKPIVKQEERPILTGKRGNNPHVGTLVTYPGRSIHYATKFNDKNALHLSAAAAVGLDAIPADRTTVMNMKGKMVPIRDTRNYIVDPLTHSVPYLCPGAAKELNAIGEAWADILKRNDLPHYKFILTSILRTQEDVRKLQRSGNVNASGQSAHCYGTTFDITYTRFEKAERSDHYMVEDNLKLALAQVLLNEQRAGHIYVKYEHKQACFHITSRL